MVFFEHVFKDGTSVRFLTKPFEPAKREVPTIEFNFVQGGSMKSLNTRLYDHDKNEDFTQPFYVGIGKYLDSLSQKALECNQGTEKRKLKLSDKECSDCGNIFQPRSPNQKKCDKCRGK